MRVKIYYFGNRLAETKRAVDDVKVNIREEKANIEYESGKVEDFEDVRGVEINREEPITDSS